jgi:predicted Zn-dependent peptidase
LQKKYLKNNYVNIPRYDEPLQKAGGENNAFTSNDITNYYLTLPKQNLETAFWLESDRMLSLAFSPKSLDVQRNVVIEEFKQVFLNQPYGDVWLLLRPLAYKVHPYQWSTIGKDISHIENARMEDVKAFYKKFYNPNNAILSIAGDVDIEKIKKLANKWFALIKKDKKSLRKLPVEPEQKSPEKLTVKRNVPFNSIYKVFHTCSRRDKEFHTVDLLSDILSNGNSSRLHQELVKKQKLFSEINAFLTGEIENGLFVISGKLIKGIPMKKAEEAINTELTKIKKDIIEKNELQKVKNKIESTLVFSEMNVLNKAMNLAFAELLGDASLINKEIEKYSVVTKEQIREQANFIFRENNCSTLYYLAQ